MQYDIALLFSFEAQVAQYAGRVQLKRLPLVVKEHVHVIHLLYGALRCMDHNRASEWISNRISDRCPALGCRSWLGESETIYCKEINLAEQVQLFSRGAWAQSTVQTFQRWRLYSVPESSWKRLIEPKFLVVFYDAVCPATCMYALAISKAEEPPR